ncbi:MAG: YidC/Oxa1 family membrane protein insertase [Clostridia bacterium]|nr:YidC/Oxa1 family membrane protein insertase [Clostridia bacterium]
MKKRSYRKLFAVLCCMVVLMGTLCSCMGGSIAKADYANLENLTLDKDHNPLYYEKYVESLEGKEDKDGKLKEEFLKQYLKEETKDGKGTGKFFYAPEDLDGDGRIDLLVEDGHHAGSEVKEEKKSFTYYLMAPVGKLLAVINDFLGSYILSLFIFAVLVKILLFWFSYKQQKSMVKQAYFKPKERAIRNKYKGRTDQATVQKMNQEIMEAQQKEGVSMFGGCLPLLIQMPIIMLLYEVIRNPLHYVAEYSITTINALKNVLYYNGVITNPAITELDMVAVLRDNAKEMDFSGILDMADHMKEGVISDLPNFYMFGNYVDLSVTPSITFEWPKVLYLLIPIVTFLALFFSMKINRKLTGAATAPAGGDENTPDMSMANGMMDLMMPAMSTVITFMVPSVLGVYWIFNNLLGTVQQFILKKMLPFPVFTEEDYKQAEREYNKGKDVKKKKKTEEEGEKAVDPNRPKVKSLHHIDDDDEDYPVLPPLKEGPIQSAEEDKKKKGKVDKASMKKEDKKDKK